MEHEPRITADAPPSYEASQALINNQPPYAPGYENNQQSYTNYGATTPYPPYSSIPNAPPQPNYQQPYNVNANNTIVVIQQPREMARSAAVVLAVTPPPDYTVLSLFSCLCCLWPIGLIAVIKSCEVKSAIAAGDYQRALSASNSAKRLAIISISIGLILIPSVILAYFAM